MATRSVTADEDPATRVIGRALLGKLFVGAEVELTSEAVEWLGAAVRKEGLDPRGEAVLFNGMLKIVRAMAPYLEE